MSDCVALRFASNGVLDAARTFFLRTESNFANADLAFEQRRLAFRA